MAKRNPSPTLEDLIAADAKPGESLTAWCERKGFPVRSLTRLLSGPSEPRIGTLTLLGHKLGTLDLPKLRAAIAASRASR